MKIKFITSIISVVLLSTMANAMNNQQGIPNKTTQDWAPQSQAVYDLLFAEFRLANAQYDDILTIFLDHARSQKNEKLYAKAFKAAMVVEDYQEATQVMTEWQKISKANLTRFAILAFTLNGEIGKAFELAETALATNSPKPINIDELIQVLQTQWHNPHVLKLTTQLANTYPQDKLLNHTYINILRWQGNIDAAIKQIDQAIFKDSKDLNLYSLKSDIYRYNVQVKQAEQVWLDLLKDYPNEPSYLFAYAQFLYDAYQFDKVIPTLDKISEQALITPANNLRLMAYAKLGKYDSAKAVFNFDKMPSEERNKAYYQLASVLIGSKQYDDARPYLEKVEPKSDLGLYAASQLASLDYQQSLEKGNTRFDKIIHDYQLSTYEALTEKSYALQRASLKKEAYQLLSDYLKKEPKNTDLLYIRSLAAEEVGIPDIAISDLQKLLTISPTNGDAQNALGYTIITHTNDIQTGMKLVKKALHTQPTSPAIVDSLGWAYYKLEKYKQSLPYFQFAYTSFIDGEIVGHYILALYHSGQVEKARKLYQLESQFLQDDPKLEKYIKTIKFELERA